MTKKRAKGAPTSADDNGTRGLTGWPFSHSVPHQTPNFLRTASPTVPDLTHAARNRTRKTQLQLFQPIGEYYERAYGETLIKELRAGSNATPVIAFQALFTDGGLKLEDVACECAFAPDAKDLNALKAAVPKARNIPRDPTFKVRLTKEQYAQLDEAYQDRSLGNGMGGK